MALQTQTVSFQVGGKDYKTQLFPANEALPIIGKFMSAIGGGFSGAEDGEMRKIALSLVGGAVQKLVASDPSLQLVRDLLKYTYQLDKSLNDTHAFNELFTGNYGDMYQVVFEVVKANDFLPKEAIGSLFAE